MEKTVILTDPYWPCFTWVEFMNDADVSSDLEHMLRDFVDNY